MRICIARNLLRIPQPSLVSCWACLSLATIEFHRQLHRSALPLEIVLHFWQVAGVQYLKTYVYEICDANLGPCW